MLSWNDGDESSEDEFVGMDMELWDGIHYGVSEWVDAPWLGVLQRCLMKVWEMFHEENHGGMVDHQAHKEETVKLKQELDSLGTQYNQLVEDKKEMDVDKQMQKMAIDKEKEKLENVLS
ncbi:hypothetical protein D1007_16707 [Hordeum vulgare]|nr:hypothetical protein D1007_16707 [Hordeum vulgare]